MIIESKSPEETLLFGESIGKRLKGGEIILLSGDLGAGKTLLTRGIAKGLKAEGSPVVSPSFTLVNIYKARLDIVHVDLYRLDSDSVTGLGLEDYMDSDHVIIVEWADIALDYFKDNIERIKIEYKGENERIIILDDAQRESNNN